MALSLILRRAIAMICSSEVRAHTYKKTSKILVPLRNENTDNTLDLEFDIF